MKSSELRDLDIDDLRNRIHELEEQAFLMRFQNATAQLDDTSKLRQARRNVARAKTILRQKELGK